MGHFYFVRHGQTVWNVEGKICGATDIALTQLGHEQAIETGKKILEEHIQADEILYSPLMRAADTAKHISGITGIPAREELRLKEQNFGIWESTPRGGEDFKKAKQSFACSYEGGESMLRLAQRIYNLLDEIKDKSDEKTYILVAHNGIARVVCPTPWSLCSCCWLGQRWSAGKPLPPSLWTSLFLLLPLRGIGRSSCCIWFCLPSACCP